MKSLVFHRRPAVRGMVLALFLGAPCVIGCSSQPEVTERAANDNLAKGNGGKFGVLKKLGTPDVLDKTASKTKKK